MAKVQFTSAMAAQLQYLLDKEAIRECLLRYSRSVDRCDLELGRSVFWEDARVECSQMFTGHPYDLLEIAVGNPGLHEQTMHMFGNMSIELQGDVANSECYAQAYHRVPAKDGRGPYDVVMGIRYVDRLEKRGDEWRVALRVMIFDWFREYPDSADWGKGAFGQPIIPGVAGGTRGPNDRVYEFVAWGGGKSDPADQPL